MTSLDVDFTSVGPVSVELPDVMMIVGTDFKVLLLNCSAL